MSYHFGEETTATVQARRDAQLGQGTSRCGEKVTDYGSVLKELSMSRLLSLLFKVSLCRWMHLCSDCCSGQNQGP